MFRFVVLAAFSAIAFAGCQKATPAAPPAPVAPAATAAVPPPAAASPTALAEEDSATAMALGPTATDFKALARADFNRLAAEQDLPLYWRADGNKNATLDADELAVTWPGDAAAWLKDGKLPPEFAAAYGLLQKRATDPQIDDSPEGKRCAAVLKELRQGRPTLIWNDFRSFMIK